MSRKKRRTDGTQRAVIAGLAGSVAAVAAYVARRARTGHEAGDDEARSPGASDAAPAAASPTPVGEAGAAHREWHCECGQELRVTGEGRHRVFWLPDAGPEDAVLDDACPECERKLSLQP